MTVWSQCLPSSGEVVSSFGALVIGAAVGIALGALAWLDSGFLVSGVIVLVVTGVFYGIWMPRRMNRYWPGARQLSGDERVAVVRTARRRSSTTTTGYTRRRRRRGRFDGCRY